MNPISSDAKVVSIGPRGQGGANLNPLRPMMDAFRRMTGGEDAFDSKEDKELWAKISVGEARWSKRRRGWMLRLAEDGATHVWRIEVWFHTGAQISIPGACTQFIPYSKHLIPVWAVAERSDSVNKSVQPMVFPHCRHKDENGRSEIFFVWNTPDGKVIPSLKALKRANQVKRVAPAAPVSCPVPDLTSMYIDTWTGFRWEALVNGPNVQ